LGQSGKRASDLAELTDGDLIERASEWTQHTPYEMELQRRLIVATNGFKQSMDTSSNRIILLTIVLVVLTVVIAIPTWKMAF
jgi:hypothetical protein